MYSSDRKLFIFVAICTVILILLGYSWKQRTQLPYVTAPLVNVATPFAYGANTVLHHLNTGIAIIDGALTRHNKVDELEKALLGAQVDRTNYDELITENIRLRQMLQFKTTHPEYDMRAAHIITRDFGYGMNTFMIDLGSEEGIRQMMPVVAVGGAVGFVSDVFAHSARVQTLLDPRTAIGVIVQRPESRLASIVKGSLTSPSNLQLVDIPKDADILEGDTLISSGYGGIYPKGILVGHVGKIETDGEGYVNHATVKPSVNFYLLEEVFVIKASSVATPVWQKQDIKLIPPSKRDQVEGIKGAVKNETR